MLYTFALFCFSYYTKTSISSSGGRSLFSLFSSLLSSNYYRHPSLLLLLQMPFIWRDQADETPAPTQFLPAGFTPPAKQRDRLGFLRVEKHTGQLFIIFFFFFFCFMALKKKNKLARAIGDAALDRCRHFPKDPKG